MNLTKRWQQTWNWEQWRQNWKDFDVLLLLLVVSLVSVGVLSIYSTRTQSSYWLQQLVMAVMGLGLVALVARIPYDTWLRWHWVTYGITLALLAAVMVVGVSGGGAERWIMVAGFKVQPSEFAKLGTIISLAALLHHLPIRYFNQILIVVALLVPPWLLVFLQPNLGTALVFVAIAAGMTFWGGARGSWLLLLLSPAVAAVLYAIYLDTERVWMLWAWLLWAMAMGALAVWQCPWRRVGLLVFGLANLLAGQLGQLAWGVLKPYQRQRLIVFMEPEADPLGSGYHLIQSKIAIGAGGSFGRGYLQGTQTQLDFIPEQHTDFIFAGIGEEWGFVGSAVVILLYWLLFLRLVIIAQSARDRFGSLLTVGVFSMLLFQTVINLGMTIGLAPITGLPLPFISYGRSALLTNFIALGLVESVAKYRERTTFFT
ncbi:MAG: rod shape-determining protein RodA [Cyanobacteria bacterium J06642_2]